MTADSRWVTAITIRLRASRTKEASNVRSLTRLIERWLRQAVTRPHRVTTHGQRPTVVVAHRKSLFPFHLPWCLAHLAMRQPTCLTPPRVVQHEGQPVFDWVPHIVRPLLPFRPRAALPAARKPVDCAARRDQIRTHPGRRASPFPYPPRRNARSN